MCGAELIPLAELGRPRVDVLITLSSFDLPCRIDDEAAVARTYERQCRMPFNVAGGPAMSVPTGFSASGIPLAMQIAGRAFDEATVYRVAWAYCEAAGWTPRSSSAALTRARSRRPRRPSWLGSWPRPRRLRWRPTGPQA